jgi:tRNA-2-methylthio-N6-dimethylallyladenosine synthase
MDQGGAQHSLHPTEPETPGSRRGLHVITWGCQMNVYDSGRMEDLLDPLGFSPVEAPELADLVVLNTCHIRERATEKVFSELGRLRVLQQQRAASGGRMMIALAGCVAQAEGEVILARAPYVDIVLGPQTYHRLPSMLRRAEAGERVVQTEFPAEDKFDYLPEDSAHHRHGALTAFLTIQEGCDKFCAFCVVPYTRGAEVSRPAAAVLAEARRLVARGAREITLLGQNVNAWHGTGLEGSTWGLGRLLRELAGIEGLARLRYTTSHPRDMDDALITAHRDIPQVMPYLHLPVQSGSDRILRQMNRRHGRDDYLRLVDRLREARGDIALSSDFIVGYPGETEADFEQTLDLVRRVGFAQAYSFAYSPRPGTAAAESTEQVPAAERAARLHRLQELLLAQQTAFNTACLSQVLDVLVTGPGRRPGQMSGRTPYLQPVHITSEGHAGSEYQGGAALVGQVVPVVIEDARPQSLGGRLDVPVVQHRSEEPVRV